MPTPDLLKYPRTPHLEGSRLQEGDEDLAQIPFAEIAGKYLVVEEKCDGANSAISFGEDGKMFRTDTWIDIDTGAAGGGAPMLLRLEDLQPFYGKAAGGKE